MYRKIFLAGIYELYDGYNIRKSRTGDNFGYRWKSMVIWVIFDQRVVTYSWAIARNNEKRYFTWQWRSNILFLKDSGVDSFDSLTSCSPIEVVVLRRFSLVILLDETTTDYLNFKNVRTHPMLLTDNILQIILLKTVFVLVCDPY